MVESEIMRKQISAPVSIHWRQWRPLDESMSSIHYLVEQLGIYLIMPLSSMVTLSSMVPVASLVPIDPIDPQYEAIGNNFSNGSNDIAIEGQTSKVLFGSFALINTMLQVDPMAPKVPVALMDLKDTMAP